MTLNNKRPNPTTPPEVAKRQKVIYTDDGETRFVVPVEAFGTPTTAYRESILDFCRNNQLLPTSKHPWKADPITRQNIFNLKDLHSHQSPVTDYARTTYASCKESSVGDTVSTVIDTVSTEIDTEVDSEFYCYSDVD